MAVTSSFKHHKVSLHFSHVPSIPYDSVPSSLIINIGYKDSYPSPLQSYRCRKHCSTLCWSCTGKRPQRFLKERTPMAARKHYAPQHTQRNLICPTYYSLQCIETTYHFQMSRIITHLELVCQIILQQISKYSMYAECKPPPRSFSFYPRKQ